MSDFDTIGQLMCLPLESIQPAENIPATPEFIVSAAAEALLKTGGHNWVPLIVEIISDYKYRAVSNHFVYTVAAQAGLEDVWCIVIKSTLEDCEQAKILAGEATPKIDLSKASRATIVSALKFLINKPGSALKSVDATIAAGRIADEDRTQWADLTPVIKLKCGITKGKKLDALSEVFYLPPPPPKPKPPKAVNIKQASKDEILERLQYFVTNKIDGFGMINPDEVTDAIFNADKGKWKTLNPITKLDCGIDTKKVKTLKTVFLL